MDQTKTETPWYKVWWKIIPFILFFAITVPVYALWYIWKRTKWTTLQKGIATAIVLLLTLIIWAGSESQSDSTDFVTDQNKVQNINSKPSEPTAAQVAEDKKKVEATYERITELTRVSDGAFGVVQKAMNTEDPVQTYFLATDAIKILQGVSDKIKEESDDLRLNDKSKEAEFKVGAKELAESVDWKRWGLQKLQEGIDNDSLKLIQEAADYFKTSTKTALSAVAKLSEVLKAYDLLDIMGN